VVLGESLNRSLIKRVDRCSKNSSDWTLFIISTGSWIFAKIAVRLYSGSLFAESLTANGIVYLPIKFPAIIVSFTEWIM